MNFYLQTLPQFPELAEIDAATEPEAREKVSALLSGALFDNRHIREDAAAFAAQVDGYFEHPGQQNRQHYLRCTHCPAILSELWGSAADIYMPSVVLEKLRRQPQPGRGHDLRHGHGMTPETIKEIAAKLHDPIIVYSSATDVSGSTLVALLDLQSKNPTSGIPAQLCAAVEFDSSTRLGKIDILTSVHGRPDQQYKNWHSRDKLVLYADTKRAVKWLPTTRVQSPGLKQLYGSGDIILTKEGFVKRQVEKHIKNISTSFAQQNGMNLKQGTKNGNRTANH